MDEESYDCLSLWDNIIELNPNFNDNRWCHDNSKALDEIKLYCGQDSSTKIKMCHTANEAWSKLSSIYANELKFNVYEIERDDNVSYLHREVLENRWESIANMISMHGHDIVSKIHKVTGLSSIHVATNTGNKEIVRKLARANPPSLLVRDKRGYAPLAFVASKLIEHIEMAEFLLDQANEEVRNGMLEMEVNGREGIDDDHGLTPVLIAARRGHKNMTKLFYSFIQLSHFLKSDWNYGKKLITFCIHTHIFDVVVDFLRCRLMSTEDTINKVYLSYETPSCKKPILELSQKGEVFGGKLNLLQRLIYKVLSVPPYIEVGERRTAIECEGFEGEKRIPKVIVRLMMKIPAIKKLYDEKINHLLALEILKIFCDEVDLTNNREELCKIVVPEAMLSAAQNGTVEYVRLLSNVNRGLLYIADGNERGVLSHAILNRQRGVFDFFCKLAEKDTFFSQEDVFGNTILHLVAELPHSDRGLHKWNAYFKIQEEFQWYKRVEDIVPTFKEKRNQDGKKASEVFTKTHKQLVEDSAKWTKDVLATLLFTFVAASIWGAIVGNITRKPEIASEYFVVANNVGFWTSFACLLSLMGIRISFKNDEEFMRTVQHKIWFALFTLFISMGLIVTAILFPTMVGPRV